MLLSTESVNVAMLMATYGVAGGFGMGLVYLESVLTFYKICSHKKDITKAAHVYLYLPIPI